MTRIKTGSRGPNTMTETHKGTGNKSRIFCTMLSFMTFYLLTKYTMNSKSNFSFGIVFTETENKENNTNLVSETEINSYILVQKAKNTQKRMLLI